jgi:hypothetical protein
MELRQQIIKELIKRRISLVPMHHCPDGEYTDFDEWDAVEVDGQYYDINFYSDGDTFFITAYYVNGTYDRENDNFFHVLKFALKETA